MDSKPVWDLAEFDADGEGLPSPINIASIFFTESSNDAEYLFVDLINSESETIVRYTVVLWSTSSDHSWVKSDLVSFDPKNYQSCVGRVSHGYVDGIYTAGKIDNRPQLVYVPVINAFGNGPLQCVALACRAMPWWMLSQRPGTQISCLSFMQPAICMLLADRCSTALPPTPRATMPLLSQ